MRKGLNNSARVLRVIVAALLLTLAFAVTSQAALPKVKITKAKAGVSKVTLKWSKAAGARGYYIFSVSASGKTKKLATVNSGSTLSKTIRKLKNGKEYDFAVQAFAGDETGEMSDTVTARPQIGNPGKVREARLLKNKNKSLWIKWAYNEKATGYQILVPDEDGEFTKVIRTITSKTKVKAKVKNLENGKRYFFKIRAYVKKGNQYGYGPLSKTIIGCPISKEVLKSLSTVHPLYYKVRMLTTMTVKGVTLKKGKKYTATSLNKTTSKRSTVAKITTGGKTVKVPTSALTFVKLVTNYKKAYNRATAESFVNAKGYDSVTDYLIWISTYTQHLYVFKGGPYNWSLVLDTPCSTGKLDFTSKDADGEPRFTETPITDSQIYAKYRYVGFPSSNPETKGTYPTGGHFGCSIAGGLMHSWTYWTTNAKNTDRDKVVVSMNKTTKESYKTPKSHGCVRMPIKKAEWIFNNCPELTTVIAY